MSFLSSLFSQDKTSESITTPLDLVTYAAGLASNQTDISPLLDTVRNVTARLDPTKSLSATDQQKLLGVYLHLEAYLTTKEAIRTFTKEGLRKRIAEPLLAQLTKYEGAAATVAAKA